MNKGREILLVEDGPQATELTGRAGKKHDLAKPVVFGNFCDVVTTFRSILIK